MRVFDSRALAYIPKDRSKIDIKAIECKFLSYAEAADCKSLGQDIWKVCELPFNRKPISLIWVFKKKKDAFNNVEYKA